MNTTLQNPGYTVRRFVDGKPAKTPSPARTTLGKLLKEERIIIEHNVPLPAPVISKRHEQVSALNEVAKRMKVGDSILIPYMRQAISNSMGYYTGYKFTQRKIGDKMRIWRVA